MPSASPARSQVRASIAASASSSVVAGVLEARAVLEPAQDLLEERRRDLVVLRVRPLDLLAIAEPRRRSTNACRRGDATALAAQAGAPRPGCRRAGAGRAGGPTGSGGRRGLREPRHEEGRLTLVAAVGVAAGAQRRRLGRRMPVTKRTR